jgi:hypothetical protein
MSEAVGPNRGGEGKGARNYITYTLHHTVLDKSNYIENKLQGVLERTNRLLCFDTTKTAQKTTRPTILLFLRVY